MSPDTLIENIGRPSSTQDTEFGVLWYHEDTAVDPATGERSFQVQIIWGTTP